MYPKEREQEMGEKTKDYTSLAHTRMKSLVYNVYYCVRMTATKIWLERLMCSVFILFYFRYFI